MVSKFLQIANLHIRVEVTLKRANLGVEVGLIKPLNYFLWRFKNYNMGEK